MSDIQMENKNKNQRKTNRDSITPLYFKRSHLLFNLKIFRGHNKKQQVKTNDIFNFISALTFVPYMRCGCYIV